MEEIKSSEAYFTFRKMLPEPNDVVTTLWSRKLVHNYINGYGLIGTLTMSAYSYETLDLDLTKKFMFPPHIYFYFDTGDGLLKMNPDSDFRLESEMKNHDLGWNMRLRGGKDKIISYINGDNLIFVNTFANQNIVYFRIHGV